MKIRDDFHLLRRAIETVSNRARINDLLGLVYDTVKDPFMAEIEKVQPVDTTMAYKPSIRRGYTPIASGWGRGLIADKTSKGLTLSLKSTSRHINIQRFGTEKKDYPIPHLPSGVAFWWGAPLPWAPSEVPEIVARAPGTFFFPQITHPGIEAYGGEDFVRRAWRAVRMRAVERFREVLGIILFRPFREMR